MIGAEITIAGPRPLRGTVRVPGDKGISHRALLFGRARIRSQHHPGPRRRGRRAAHSRRARAARRSGEGLRGVDGGRARHRRRRTARAGRGDRLRQLGHDDAHARRPARGPAVPHRAQRRRSLQARPMGRVARSVAHDGSACRRARGRRARAPRDPGRWTHGSPDRARRRERAGEDGGDPRRPPGRGDDRGRSSPRPAATTPSGCSTRARRAGHTSRRPHVRVEAGVPTSFDLDVPGDPSSAAFFAVAACITPGSDDRDRGRVASTRRRLGFVDVLRRMGARHRRRADGRATRRAGRRHLAVAPSPLAATTIGRRRDADRSDEIPVLAVAAAFADGVTEIQRRRRAAR